eukprot:symbB.v1.2.040914.t1/scaffold7649.1/size11652/1
MRFFRKSLEQRTRCFAAATPPRGGRNSVPVRPSQSRDVEQADRREDWNAGIAALGRKKHWRAALATAEEMHHRRHG